MDVNKGDVDYIEETIKKDPTHNQAEALVEIYQRCVPRFGHGRYRQGVDLEHVFQFRAL